jgi:hypothetical protein
VIAGAEKREQRACGGAHPARENERGLGTFEHRYALLDNLFVGRVAVPRVHEIRGAGRTNFLNEVD